MPFNYNPQVRYNPMSQATIKAASKSPFEIAGKAMSGLDEAIENRAFNRDIAGVKDLQGLAGLNPQSDKSRALYAAKQSGFNALNQQQDRINQQQNREELLQLQKQQFEREAAGTNLANQEARRAFEMKDMAQGRLDVDSMIASGITPTQYAQSTGLESLGVPTDGVATKMEQLSLVDRINNEKILGQTGTFDLLKEGNDTAIAEAKARAIRAKAIRDKANSNVRVVKVIGEDGNPKFVSTNNAQGLRAWENPTQKESEARDLADTSDFKAKYGHLPLSEQRDMAMQEVSNRTSSYAGSIKDIGSTFSVQNQSSNSSTVDDNYSNLNNKSKSKLRLFQQDQPIGKEHINNNAQKSIAVEEIHYQADKIFNMTEEQWGKGAVSNQIDSLASMIPDNWGLLTKKQKSETMNQIKGQGILGNIFFTYLNKVNKGAPSDADMKVMKEIVTGGDNVSLSGTKQALSTWMRSVDRDTSAYYNGYYSEINTLMSKKEKDSLGSINERIKSDKYGDSKKPKPEVDNDYSSAFK